MSISYGDFYFTRTPDDISIKPGNIILDKDNDVLVIDDDVNHRHYIGGGGNGGGVIGSDLYTENGCIINPNDIAIVDETDKLNNVVGTFGDPTNFVNKYSSYSNFSLILAPSDNTFNGNTNFISNSVFIGDGVTTNGVYNSQIFTSKSNGIINSSDTRATIIDSRISPYLNFIDSDVVLKGSNVYTPEGTDLVINHSKFFSLDSNWNLNNFSSTYQSDITAMNTNYTSSVDIYMSRFFASWNHNFHAPITPHYCDCFFHDCYVTSNFNPYWSSIYGWSSNFHGQTIAHFSDIRFFDTSCQAEIDSYTQAYLIDSGVYGRIQGGQYIGNRLYLTNSAYNVVIGGDSNVQNSTYAVNLGYQVNSTNSSYSILGGYYSTATNSQNSVLFGYNINMANANFAVAIGNRITNARTNSVIIGNNHNPAATGPSSSYTHPQVLIGGATNYNTTDRLAIADATDNGYPHELVRYTYEKELIFNSEADIDFNFVSNGISSNIAISELATAAASLGDINTILASIVGA